MSAIYILMSRRSAIAVMGISVSEIAVMRVHQARNSAGDPDFTVPCDIHEDPTVPNAGARGIMRGTSRYLRKGHLGCWAAQGEQPLRPLRNSQQHYSDRFMDVILCLQFVGWLAA